MPLLITGGSVVTPYQNLTDHTLIVEDGKIVALRPGRPSTGGPDDEVIDARGMWVAPGLIDVHTHGGAGSDTMDATPEALHRMARFYAQHGVTAYLPTTLAAPSDAVQRAIANVIACPQPDDGAQHLGLHLEGPYLSQEHRGAQPPAALREPQPAEYRPWFKTGHVRLMTVAPELEGALALIEEGVAAGVEFAVGHSGASYDQMMAAADRGLRQSTHTFNGMLGLHHREPGTVGAVLADDRIYAQVIPDGVHLHPAVVRLLVRAKGPARTILITDSIRAAGFQDGEYDLGGQTVTVRDGIARTAAGGLAGSTVTMDAAVRNVMAFAGVTLSEALVMAAAAPAEAMGWVGRKGVLAPGADADVVIFDATLHVHLTMVAGRVIYRAA